MTIVARNNITVSNVNDGTITHTAYAYSADGTDRFTTTYPGENFIRNSDFRNGLGNWHGDTSKFIISQESGDNLVTVTVTGQNNIGVKASLYGTTMPVKTNDYIIVSGWFRGKDIEAGLFFIVEGYDSNGTRVQYNDIATNTAGLVWSTPVTNNTWSKFYLRWKITNANAVSAGFRFVPFHNGTYSYKKFKLEADTPDRKATPWIPSKSEAKTADYPSYIGQYSDFSFTVSTDPAKYAPWIIFKGNDGVGIQTTDITYAISTSGTTAPSTGWTSTVPTLVKGQYLWTKTTWTYTDNSSETGYSVTYISKDGINGTDGTSGIIVSSVAPDSPQTGQLWQDTSTTPQLVKKWTGNEWVIWELYAQNLKADTLETISATIGKISNTFDNSSGGIDNKGTITIEDSVKVVYYLGNSSTTIDLVTSSSGQGLFTQYLPDKTDTSKFKQAWYTPSYLYFSDTINNWNGQITAENVTLVPWTNLTYSAGYTTAENNPCQYRKIKNLDGSYTVQFRGQVKPVSGSFPGTNSESNFQIIANLPVDIRPIRHTFLSAVGDMMGTQTIRIGALSDGRIQVGVRGTESSYIGINSLIYTI